MGNFEKLVVLTVLFLLAIVGGVMLNDDDTEAAGPADPYAAAAAERGEESSRETTALIDPTPEPETPPAPAVEPVRNDLLLDSTIRKEEPVRDETPVDPVPEEVKRAPVDRAANSIPSRRRILVDDTGLRPALVGDDFMIYTVRNGDTWAGLSQRFYRDTSYLTQLHNANEEMDVPVAGEEILVPVIDLSYDAGHREALRPAPRPERSVTRKASREEAVPADPLTTTTYTVVSGDNLSAVSEKVYGTPHRWKEIYEANRDRLDSPDWVKVGMELRIPR